MRRISLLLVISISLMGQSAYYRLGYGDLYPAVDPLGSSLGSGIVALIDSARITSHNPATLNHFNRVYFDVSLGSEYKSIDDVISNKTRLEKLSFATPLGSNIGMSLGLLALNDFSSEYSATSTDGTFSERSEGGIWDFQFGLGYGHTSNLNFGLKLHLLHGFLRRQSTLKNEESTEMYVINGTIDGKSLEIGSIAKFGPKVTLGLTADIPIVIPVLSGEDSLAGTVDYVKLEEELSAWPTTIKLGLVYDHSRYTKILSGISQQLFPENGFHNAKIFALPSGWTTVPVASFQASLLRLPLDRTSRNLIRRTGWQAGISIKNYYLESATQNFIYEYALISGINFGLRNTNSIFDLSGEFGSRGGDESLPTELFGRVKIGIQVNEIWFRKAKRR
ncbi:MAG: hypothetical protein K9N35_09485 [Candidatus Marinimicrobia bacterium]|nr:hypothetical protein [Candidatus Neomarinimicrobiota bacterium]